MSIIRNQSIDLQYVLIEKFLYEWTNGHKTDY